jgi:hypothetical protein
MWSAVEVNVGLICACILVIKPLLMLVVKHMPGTLQESRSAHRSVGEAVHPFESAPHHAGGLKLEVSHVEYSGDGSTGRTSNNAPV